MIKQMQLSKTICISGGDCSCLCFSRKFLLGKEPEDYFLIPLLIANGESISKDGPEISIGSSKDFQECKEACVFRQERISRCV